MPDTNHGERSINPSVSILIAARNEETTILRCLEAIAQLDFPIDDLDVLIGNDQSTDQTGPIVAAFIADKPQFRLVPCNESINELRGKANVLAQLAAQATGDFFFFTDADTEVPHEWVLEMRRHLTPAVGIVSGITLPEGPAIFHKLQVIDWLYNLTLTYLVSSAGVPVTAMGNNMAVSRSAYESVGGYDELPFSVVEDYTLFKAVVRQGFGFRTVVTPQTLARTKAVDTLPQFLQQRKRWMRGAVQLPVWMVISLYVQYLALPLLLLIGWFSPALAIGLYVAKLFIQTFVISFGINRLRQTKLWPYALLFDAYLLIIGPLSVLFYWLPTPISWKGRTYN
ncbi:glycosyltransferase family 2 protein [Spirosoma agri]|uniref:Glycosyltransferase n=1 Tax=Spirosoma agri TaxID=1987381 RepID=A0A6M0IKJ3_9BACT|nr:glycosyltransferase family 2 protein [Spirosoma agri]NEU67463.1 glycosyltransferase [Spirosoma agri]